MRELELTGYFIKDLQQYANISELIGSSNNVDEKEDLKKIRHEFLLELIKQYH